MGDEMTTNMNPIKPTKCKGLCPKIFKVSTNGFEVG
jgi:hypothetical protein